MSQMLTCGPIAAPGTPQRVVSSTSPVLAQISGFLSGSIAPRGTTITFQAHPANTAGKSIYIGQSPSMSVSGKTGIGMALLTGSAPVQIFADDGLLDLGDFWMDTDDTLTVNKLLVTVGP